METTIIETTDYELIKMALEGNEESFAELVNRYKKLIYNVVGHYIKDREEVNDVSQEVFIKIYRSLGSYNPQFKFSTWSVRIATNLCLDILRKKKVVSVSMDEMERYSTEKDTPEDKYFSKQKSLQIREAIDQLPEKYRTPVILYHQNGVSYKEIAEMLNKPMSMVKNRLFRARLMLRQSLVNCKL